MNDKFQNLITKHFMFLVKDFNAKCSGLTPYGATFESEEFIIRIGSDHGELILDIGTPDKKDTVYLNSVIKFKDPKAELKYLFIGLTDGENEMESLASNLKKYGMEFLFGDFSNFESVKKKQTEEYEKWLSERKH